MTSEHLVKNLVLLTCKYTICCDINITYLAPSLDAKLLGYNYLSSDWYKKSYQVFNQDYSEKTNKKIKKDKKGVIEKFKKLFD